MVSVTLPLAAVLSALPVSLASDGDAEGTSVAALVVAVAEAVGRVLVFSSSPFQRSMASTA